MDSTNIARSNSENKQKRSPSCVIKLKILHMKNKILHSENYIQSILFFLNIF